MDNISRLKKRFNEILDEKYEVVIDKFNHNRWIYKWKGDEIGDLHIKFAIASISYYIKTNYLGYDWYKFNVDEYAKDYLQAKMKHINKKPV